MGKFTDRLCWSPHCDEINSETLHEVGEDQRNPKALPAFIAQMALQSVFAFDAINTQKNSQAIIDLNNDYLGTQGNQSGLLQAVKQIFNRGLTTRTMASTGMVRWKPHQIGVIIDWIPDFQGYKPYSSRRPAVKTKFRTYSVRLANN